MKKNLFCVTLALIVSLWGCADIGERDNPTDPSADNYDASLVPGGNDGGDDGSDDVSSSSEKSVSSSSSPKEKSSSSSDRSSDSKSSSSGASSSSSFVKVNVSYGKMTDARDNQTYKTVKIGSQVWMAQNLNYRDLRTTESLDSVSFCFNGEASFCEKWGRLYMWSAAIDSAGTFSTDGQGCGNLITCGLKGKVRGVCPEGWHMPSTEDYDTLVAVIGGEDNAGNILKTTSGWKNFNEGLDLYGFSAVPGGNRSPGGTYTTEGVEGHIWLSTEQSKNYGISMFFRNTNAKLFLQKDVPKNRFSSVRCLMDEGGAISSPDDKSSSSAGSSSSVESVLVCEDDDLWCMNNAGTYRVKTGFSQEDNNTGRWFAVTDKDNGALSRFIWPAEIDGVLGADSFNAVIDSCHGFCGSIVLDAGDWNYDPYVVFGFNVAGGKDDDAADVTEWGGICVVYTADVPLAVQLGLGRLENAYYNNALPEAVLNESAMQLEKSCLMWDDFAPPPWGEHSLSGMDAASRLVTIEFRIQDETGTSGKFNILRLMKNP